jgi:Ala-tRNA(Pro) deacylase
MLSRNKGRHDRCRLSLANKRQNIGDVYIAGSSHVNGSFAASDLHPMKFDANTYRARCGTFFLLQRSVAMNVDNFLSERNVAFDLIPHRDTYDAQRMAQVLHVAGREVAKTVLLRADGDYAYVVAVLPATKHIDLAKAGKVLGGTKLELATEVEIAEHCPDCEFGVLPPFGSQYNMRTLVDESLTEDEEIYFEGNTHHESIRMKFADFRRLEEPLIASFATE